jgi:hypothetical protein
MRNKTLTKAIAWGLFGGLVSTVIMDLVIIAFFLAVRMPIDLIYSFIGEVAQSFFLRIGSDAPGRFTLGAFIHLSLGLLLGGLFGVMVSQFRTLRLGSLKKGILLGVLYIEVISQPILVTAPLLKEMTASAILQWYGLSTVMHTIYGIILGGFLSYKQKKTAFMKNPT